MKNKFDDCTFLLESPEKLRKKAEEDGFLFFSNLINRDTVSKAREKILNLINEQGWLNDSFPINNGIVKDGIKVMESPDESWVQFYKKLICLPEFNSLAFEPAILETLKIVLGTEVLPHCRKVCRVYSPSDFTYATPPHRDYTWTGGTTNFWTAWIPLGDLSY